MATHGMLNKASGMFADIIAQTKDELRKMQSTPIGTEPRSGQEQAAMWRKLRLLPETEFNAVLNAAAVKSGHQMNETEPCSTCNFVATHAGREGRRAK